jgi:nitric oxide synthase-interacting protein
VLCGSCVDKFMTSPDTPGAHDARNEHGRVLCYVCETDVTGRERKHKVAADVAGSKNESRDALPAAAAAAAGLVEISCEGTGFAGGGSNMAKREGVAFQC